MGQAAHALSMSIFSLYGQASDGTSIEALWQDEVMAESEAEHGRFKLEIPMGRELPYHKGDKLQIAVNNQLPRQTIILGNAGTSRKIVLPKTPQPSNTNTGLERHGKHKQPVAAGVSFHIKTIRIIGNTLFSTAVLHSLIADSENKTLSLKQLNALADRLTGYYRQHGYSLTRAVIPAQGIKHGVVTIHIKFSQCILRIPYTETVIYGHHST